MRGLANYYAKNYQKAKTDFEVLINNEKFLADANFYLGNIAILDWNRELAVSFWLKAKELKHENANIKLDQFYTFLGNYLLDSSQLIRKLNCNTSVQHIYIRNVKYLGGLSQIDEIEKLDLFITHIKGFDLGLDVELKTTYITYHLAISYCEIENIIYKEADKLFELHLIDNNILKFSYFQTMENKKALYKICDGFKQATGKTPEAANL